MEAYTVKEIASQLNCSKPTVQKAINNLKLEADRIEKNKFRYYSQEKVELIAAAVIAKAKPQTLSTNRQTIGDNEPTTANAAPETAKIIDKPQTPQIGGSTVTELLDMLKAELAKKDEELQRKEQRITELQSDLKAAYAQVSEQADTIAALAKQASYITAADKTAQLMDKQIIEDDAGAAQSAAEAAPQPVEKQNWFRRLFKW